MVVSKSTYLVQSCVHINLIVVLIEIGNLNVSKIEPICDVQSRKCTPLAPTFS